MLEYSYTYKLIIYFRYKHLSYIQLVCHINVRTTKQTLVTLLENPASFSESWRHVSITWLSCDVLVSWCWTVLYKVLEWSPEAIDEGLSSFSTLPLSCQPKTIDGLVCMWMRIYRMKLWYVFFISLWDVELSHQPNGLPLDLPNHLHPFPRSYPFRGKDDSYMWATIFYSSAECIVVYTSKCNMQTNMKYFISSRIPVMGLVVNLTSLSVSSGETRFSIKITCSVNLTAIGLDSLPRSRLPHLYELPSSATTSISVQLWSSSPTY